jgi:hypothetical protein
MRIHREWGSVRIELGPLWLIRCARHPSGRRTLDHPNAWMVVWRRGLPEWTATTSGRWETLPALLENLARDEFDWRGRREPIVERADEDEPDKVRLLQAFAPIACFKCNHPDARKARAEIVMIIRAIRQREPLPQGDLPVNCCRRQAEQCGESQNHEAPQV